MQSKEIRELAERLKFRAELATQEGSAGRIRRDDAHVLYKDLTAAATQLLASEERVEELEAELGAAKKREGILRDRGDKAWEQYGWLARKRSDEMQAMMEQEASHDLSQLERAANELGPACKALEEIGRLADPTKHGAVNDCTRLSAISTVVREALGDDKCETCGGHGTVVAMPSGGVTECGSCDGSGTITVAVPECCGRVSETGDCCGSPDAVPEMARCPECNPAAASAALHPTGGEDSG